MSKYCIVALAIAMSLSIVGCGSTTPAAGGGDTTNTQIIKGSISRTAPALTMLREWKPLRALAEYILPSAWASYLTGYQHAGNASAYQLTFMKIYFSTASDCGMLGSGVSPTLVKDFGSSGQAFDLAANPTIADISGVAAGTYQCVIFQLGDYWTATPDATAQANFAGCANGQPHSFDICVQSNGQTGKDLDGNKMACVVGQGTAIWTLFFPVSTTQMNALNAAGYVSFGTIPAAITLPRTSALTFYADTSVIAGANPGYGDNATGMTDYRYWGASPNNDSSVCYVDGPMLGFR